MAPNYTCVYTEDGHGGWLLPPECARAMLTNGTVYRGEDMTGAKVLFISPAWRRAVFWIKAKIRGGE